MKRLAILLIALLASIRRWLAAGAGARRRRCYRGPAAGRRSVRRRGDRCRAPAGGTAYRGGYGTVSSLCPGCGCCCRGGGGWSGSGEYCTPYYPPPYYTPPPVLSAALLINP